MKIAITFLTCDRTEMTNRTLATLSEFNDLSRFMLLHGDDSSNDQEGPSYARRLGFETVVQTSSRRGVAAMTAALFQEAAHRGADLILNLQNDWESARAVPVDDIVGIFQDHPEVYCLRLYGRLKSHHGRCGIHHGGRRPLQVVEWKPFREGYEIGDIHWGHPPSVTRTKHAVKLTRDAKTESESRMRSGKITDMTVRVVDNVFNHIGTYRTKGFKA